MKNITCNACGKATRQMKSAAEIAEVSAVYEAPEVRVCVYAMEKGFALSLKTESYGYQEDWFDEASDQVVGNENYREGFCF